MCFKPCIGLHRNDKHGKVENILFQHHQIIGDEHFIEQYAFAVPEKTKDQIDQQQYIYDIHVCHVAPLFS